MKDRILITRGDRFGRLVVIGPAPRDRRGTKRWNCICDCGKRTTTNRDRLLNGSCKSCGCLQKERLTWGRGKTDSPWLTKTRTYRSWQSIKKRILNPKNISYPNYGGRGITVCERWMKFKNFLADMGPRPLGTTIGRIDNDGNYCPENCAWQTPREQGEAKQNTHYVIYEGQKIGLPTLSRKLGISRDTLYGRLQMGWPTERLSKPVSKHENMRDRIREALEYLDLNAPGKAREALRKGLDGTYVEAHTKAD